VVLVRFDNGAMATAEASFNAVYGYDIRGEVFGSAGMATAGDIRRTTMAYHGAEGVLAAIASVDTGQPVQLDTVQQP
jgi:myo-inositol 2-dehydrogenase / D-chiro-inositol 1-dehydrogenase